MPLNLAEELLVITLQEPGLRWAREELRVGLRGAALVELVLQRRLTLQQDGRGQPVIIALDPGTTGSWVLDDVRVRVARRAPCSAETAFYRVPDDLDAAISEELAEQGILRKRAKLFGLAGARYVLAKPEEQAGLPRRLRSSLLAGAAPDTRTAILMLLAAACRTSTAGAIFTIEEIEAGTHDAIFGRLRHNTVDSGYSFRSLEELAPDVNSAALSQTVGTFLEIAEVEAAAARPAA